MHILIQGENDGYGNGYIDIEQTYISIQRVDLIAGSSLSVDGQQGFYEIGKFQEFTIEFRTNEGKRLALDEVDGFLAFDHTDANRVSFKISKTKYDNRYTVVTESTKAYTFEDDY